MCLGDRIRNSEWATTIPFHKSPRQKNIQNYIGEMTQHMNMFRKQETKTNKCSQDGNVQPPKDIDGNVQPPKDMFPNYQHCLGRPRKPQQLELRTISIHFHLPSSGQPPRFSPHGSVSKPCTPVVHIKIAGKWMFIPLNMVLIGIDPYPHFSRDFQ